LIIALLALAQKVGNYENKPLAITLLILAASAFLWLIISWVREKRSSEELPTIAQESHGSNSPNILGDRNKIG